MELDPAVTVRQNPKNLVGWGGWLILFQIIMILRTVLGIYAVVSEPGIWAVVYVVLLLSCVILFYCKLLLFRVAYAASILISIIISFMNVDMTGYIIWNFFRPVVINIFFVYGLFMSQRVKNTFRGIFYKGIEL